MKKMFVAMALGMIASIGYGNTLTCRSHEITFTANLDARVLKTQDNQEISIKAYNLNLDGAGAMILDSGNLVTLIDDTGSLWGELYVEGKTYHSLDCTFN